MAYNGHKNWNHWNVSLWINNDENLYRLASRCIKSAHTREYAARMFMGIVTNKQTPDGAPYTVSSVMAAMRGM